VAVLLHGQPPVGLLHPAPIRSPATCHPSNLQIVHFHGTTVGIYIYKMKTVECGYRTEPKATCCQYKNQPNPSNMYTDLEGILFACLCLHVSFYPWVVNLCRYVFPHSTGKIQINRKKPPKEY
jgi:hypothetical protein